MRLEGAVCQRGKLHRCFGGVHPRFEVLRNVVATAGRKPHGGHAKALIGEQLAKLPHTGIGKLAGAQRAASLDFYGVGPHLTGQMQGTSQGTPQRGGGNSDFEFWHHTVLPVVTIGPELIEWANCGDDR